MSSVDRQHFDAVVVALLGPLVGSSMAQAAIDGHCRNLKIQGPTLGANHLEALIHRLHQGMTIFVGPEKALSLAQSLRSEMALGQPLGETRPMP